MQKAAQGKYTAGLSRQGHKYVVACFAQSAMFPFPVSHSSEHIVIMFVKDCAAELLVVLS